MRPETPHNPAVKLVEELADVGLAIILAPTSNDRVDLIDQLLRTDRSLAPGTLADLVLEVPDGFYTRNRIARSPANPARDLRGLQPESRFRKSCGSGQSADEEHDGGGVEEGAGRGDGGLEVLCQSPVAVDPGEEALHDPAARLDGEADLIGAFAHDLDGDHGGRGDLLAGVAAVGKDLLDERKRAA